MSETRTINKLARTLAAPAAFVGTAVGSYLGLQALKDLPAWVIGLIENQGSDFLVAFTILGAAIYFAPSFIQSQKDQAMALTSVAETLRALPQKDDMKFESIIIGQEVLNRSLDRMHARLDSIERERAGSSDG